VSIGKGLVAEGENPQGIALLDSLAFVLPPRPELRPSIRTSCNVPVRKRRTRVLYVVPGVLEGHQLIVPHGRGYGSAEPPHIGRIL